MGHRESSVGKILLKQSNFTMHEGFPLNFNRTGVMQYSQTGNLNDINWKSVAISGAAGALGVGMESQISKLGLTLGWRIGLNAFGNATLGTGSRILTNITGENNQIWSNGALTAGAVSGLFSVGGSALQSGASRLNAHLADRIFDELPLSDKLFLSANPLYWAAESQAFEKVTNAVGLGVSSLSPLYEGCK